MQDRSEFGGRRRAGELNDKREGLAKREAWQSKSLLTDSQWWRRRRDSTRCGMRGATCWYALVDQLFNSSEKRLARALLLIARYGNNEKPTKIVARISQGTLAEMVGTTRSRVSFFMNRFRKLGFIKYDGGLEVNDSLLRVILHD
jgi:CRP-like cAMP-binding protein